MIKTSIYIYCPIVSNLYLFDSNLDLTEIHTKNKFTEVSHLEPLVKEKLVLSILTKHRRAPLKKRLFVK